LDATKSIAKRIANKINGAVVMFAVKHSAAINVRCLVLKTNQAERLHAAKSARMIHMDASIINKNALCVLHFVHNWKKRKYENDIKRERGSNRMYM
jgi:hypothetical protein